MDETIWFLFKHCDLKKTGVVDSIYLVRESCMTLRVRKESGLDLFMILWLVISEYRVLLDFGKMIVYDLMGVVS